SSQKPTIIEIRSIKWMFSPMNDLRHKLKLSQESINAINAFLLKEDNPLINDLLEVVENYGGVEEINRKAKEARNLDNLMQRVREKKPEFAKDLEWLIEQRDKGAFISMENYQKKVLGDKFGKIKFKNDYIVTLELSALQYFPFLIEEAKIAIEKGELMPGRFIRVRKMKEQEEDGDLLAVAAAMQILGSSLVETLDTKGTMPGPDGAPVNVHLGGPETITGYFGGVGQPNDCALKWADELLYYYTNYGVPQVLNINPGTVLIGYMLHRLGIDIEFKISVFMGNDNPYSVFWTLMTAKLFERDNRTPLIGFNLSNAVNNETIELTSLVREALGFTDVVRIEHHIIETYKAIVRQPYNRRGELVDVAQRVKNISAKHEGGDPDVDSKREHPSSILDYFRDKKEVIESGDWDHLLTNYKDRHDSVNNTAKALIMNGIPVLAAPNLHK
ncbi:MAG: hypothetical protein ACFFB3_17230, partial [Candidatus Hodarchaeota archaeon]